MTRVLFYSSVAALASLFASLPLAAAEVTFQNGSNGYESAVSTTLHGVSDKQTLANYGGAQILGVAGVKHGGFKQLGLVKFGDIIGDGDGRIPQRATIDSARLELYKIDEPSDSGQYEKAPKHHREIRAFKMLTDWKAGTGNATTESGSSCFAYRYFDGEEPTFWGTANVLEEGPVRNLDFQFTPRAAAPLIPNSGAMWMSWDVTEYVQEWVNDPESNRGMFFNALGYYVGAFFASCQHDDLTLRPRLVVEYH